MKKLLLLVMLAIPICATAQRLNKQQSAAAKQDFFERKTAEYVKSIEDEWAKQVLVSRKYSMPFWYKISGTKPAAG